MSIAEGDLKVGDRVVYPNQGVCRVVGTAEMEIAGRRETFVKLSREDDQAVVMVPQGRVAKVGLRRVASTEELQKIFDFLAAPVEGPELDWKVRHRSHGERMAEGGLMGLAQVVKGLATLSDLRPLPPKERELYDNARHLLVCEVAASASISEVSAEDAVDVALFPPGVERVKPPLAAPLSAAADELELGEDELATGLEDLELGGGPAEEAVEGAEAEEQGEAEPEAEAEGGEEEGAKPARKPHQPKAEKPKAARKAKAAAPKKEKAKPEPKKKAAAKPAAAKPARKPKAKAAAEKPKKASAKPKAKAKK